MLGRFSVENRIEPIEAEIIIRELYRADSASEFLVNFDMRLVKVPLGKSESLDLVALVSQGVAITAKEGEKNVPSSSKILACLVENGLLELEKKLDAETYKLSDVSKGLEATLYRLSKELSDAAEQNAKEIEAEEGVREKN